VPVQVPLPLPKIIAFLFPIIVASSSTGGLEMKSYVDADASEVKTDLGGGKEPTKEEVA
jgi:hypothetical protein